MVALEVLLRLVGGFYVFAGIVAMRAVVMDRMMDQMLMAISMKAQPAKEAQKRWLWALSAMAICMGGAALMVLSLWAVPLFVIGLVTQVIYLIWARTAFPPENPLEAKGRQQTTNAAILYGVATMVVAAAGVHGLLRPLLDIWAVFVPATGVAVLLTIGRHLIWSPSKRSYTGFGDPDDHWPEPEPRPEVKRVRLEPLWIGLNLVDLDTGEGVDPWDKVDDALATRIYTWALAFRATDNGDDQRVWAEFASKEAEDIHRIEGDAIVAELTKVFGEGNAEGPAYPNDIRYID